MPLGTSVTIAGYVSLSVKWANPMQDTVEGERVLVPTEPWLKSRPSGNAEECVDHSSLTLIWCFLGSNREHLPALVKMPMVDLLRGVPRFRVIVTEPFTIWADQPVPAPPAY